MLSVGGLTVGGRPFVVDSRWWTFGDGQFGCGQSLVGRRQGAVGSGHGSGQ